MFLKNLLENDHPLFTHNLQQLERATGNAGVDTRLVADITHKAHEIMRSIGLDPADTTGSELYNGLKNHVRSDKFLLELADCDYVLIDLGDGPISLNIQDVVESAHHELPYEKRQTGHGKRHLRLEVIRRYEAHDRTHNELVHKLAEEMGVKYTTDGNYPLVKPTKDERPYLLAIGDIFTDAFIKLREDQARIDTDPDGSKWLSMPFGNKPPYDGVEIVRAVGPSPNAGVSCARLGLDVGLMAWLGDDQPGQESLDYLHQEGIDTTLITTQKDTKSNYYYVLRYGADRTILVKNEAYDYAWKTPAKAPDWLYLSLISETSWRLHEDMLAYLNEHPQVKLAFQPGTFHFEWGAKKLARVYARSYIVVLNREEAGLVTGKSTESVSDLAKALHELGPEVVVITDGPDGAYASYHDKLIQIPNYPDPAPPYDRTGAGDAFASTVVAALALGESIETALRWAPINSMSVVQKLGAQAGLLHRNDIERYLQEAPADYTVKELSS